MLFLGDYVGRSPIGVEVIAYLFASKLLAPKCVDKYGYKLGGEVWASVNNVLDTLALAAIIDDQVLCYQGGIPPAWLCPVVTAVDSIPCPLPNSQEDSALAWDIMWNDPMCQVNDEVSMELSANDGFVNNTRRGTGHVFSNAALDKFLMSNNLKLVVRAHETNESLSEESNSQVQFELITLATLHDTTMPMSVLLSDESNSQVQFELADYSGNTARHDNANECVLTKKFLI
uniref:Serine/threonine specific protein phosphatases domain-containing protein n=1 Tax=Timema tahoe TaxID=61484 RepID=A0A7R9I9V6_9NEOP|nr:unnamed protein product [Timema tahoe]